MQRAVVEQGRRGRDAGAHAGAEVGRDPRGHRGVAAVGVEAREVEAEPLGPRPQVRVLEPALVGEQRVVHLPEGALAAAASAAQAAAKARGWAPRTGKWRNATRSGSARRRSSSAAQNGHS